jgi:hypothetical protein
VSHALPPPQGPSWIITKLVIYVVFGALGVLLSIGLFIIDYRLKLTLDLWVMDGLFFAVSSGAFIGGLRTLFILAEEEKK